MREALLLLVLIGCDGEEPSTDATDSLTDDTDVDSEADPCAPYTWQTVGAPHVRAWCGGCHGSALPEALRAGAPVGVDFDTYDDVLQWSARIEARATGETPEMPPGGGPSEAEVQAFTTWLVDCGAQ